MADSAMNSECTVWAGRKDQDGYGLTPNPYGWSRDIRLHRLAWIQANGLIPKGICVLHKCDNRACYNVAHLFLGTQQDNLRDMTAKGRRRFRVPTGELAAKAKLTLMQVERIRNDPRSNKLIAAEYGVSATNIHGIKTGKIWRSGNTHVQGDCPASQGA